ncbi:MAG: NADH-quinone oxidoreductase subunit N, partial [Beijerinckiaceae bacterium]|nr:NADH-quinone oxidoreductase subunit N [Beijerinckiaceae bacterium]
MALPALGPALPEIILAIGAIGMVLVGAIRGERSTRLLEGAALALFALALVLVLAGEGRALTFNGGFVVDSFARFFKVLTLLGAAAAILLSSDALRRDGSMRFEFPILIVLSTIGMMMMISANDLISLYVGLELQSLALYVVAAFDRDNPKSTEAGLKYFVLGALSSGMLLYGASLVYGFTGTVNYAGIAAAVQGGNPGIGLIFGIVFIAAGVAFKISAVPFHMWTPDVYEGAPTPVAAFFASAPKMAAMAMVVRIFVGAFPGALHEWQQIVIFIAIASMALGAFAAIGQT